MEALLEKEGRVESWNDDRLDELSQTMKEGFERVDRRFERVEGEMTNRFDKVDHKFDRLTDKVDKLFYIQLFFFVSLAIAVISHAVSV
jgi:hypothetical protein